MPSFKDATGEEWLVEFDGLLLGQVRDETKIDLADPTGGGYVQIQFDPISLVRVLQVLLRDAIPERMKLRDFARRFRGQALEDAYAAIWGAAENFFPKRLWSMLQSNCTQLRTTAEARIQTAPLLAAMERMPPAMRAAALERLAEEMTAAGSSSDGSKSTVTHLTVEAQLTPASITPELQESTPAA